MTDRFISTILAHAARPLLHRVWLAAVFLLLFLCSAGGQARAAVDSLSPTVEQGTAALCPESHLFLEHAVGPAATLVQLHGQMRAASGVFEASTVFSGSELEAARPSAATSTTARAAPAATASTAKSTTITVTTSAKADEATTSTTTTKVPKMTTGTTIATTDSAASGRSRATLSARVLAIIVIGSIAGSVLLAVGTALLVLRCPCFLLCCKRTSPTRHKEEADAAKASVMREAESFGGAQRGRKSRNCAETNQASVQQVSESGVLALHGHRSPNPLALPFLHSPKRPLPPVAGDPAHVNNFNNRPHVQNGIVPWTGRPPVLRGPQPACMVPTITNEGQIIPHEQRVLPGLGLFETPIIPFTLPVPPPLPKTGVLAAFARVKELFRAVLSSFRGPMPAEAEQAATDATRKDQPVIQWFHHLVYFTAVDKTPDISDLDESCADECEKDEDDVFTVPDDFAGPVTTDASAASAGAFSKPPPPETAGASVLEPRTAYVTAGMPLASTDRACCQYQVPQRACWGQHYPPTYSKMAENSLQMVMLDFSHPVSYPVAPAHGTSGGGSPRSCPFPFQKPSSPQLQLNEQRVPLFPQQTALSQATRNSSSSTECDGAVRELQTIKW
ncbi:hypothetical protein CUR178_02835 [Leishmania enriettii]|uniref:Membrane-associated protein n=1 Tax=Leishmania enriettii TaxID=5663 RepID=A0A836KIR8_LEIEN|nr:hypothetical protein CUR178_02835 [Leishmania enriettii]